MKFKYTGKEESVTCYGQTFAKEAVDVVEPAYIEKLSRNPDFEEVKKSTKKAKK